MLLFQSSTASEWPLLFVGRTFISIEKKWSGINLMSTQGPGNFCYIKNILNAGHIHLQTVQIEWYIIDEKLVNDWLAVGQNEQENFFQVYIFTLFKHECKWLGRCEYYCEQVAITLTKFTLPVNVLDFGIENISGERV